MGEIAKQANQIVKKVLERLETVPTRQADFDNFKDVPTIYNNASGMINGDERKDALLDAWMLSQATNAVFLLWRRGVDHEDIAEEWRKLPATDDVVQHYEDTLKPDKEIADKLEAERREFMNHQHELDIFKAVLNGKTKEEAEARYQEYQNKVAKSVGA